MPFGRLRTLLEPLRKTQSLMFGVRFLSPFGITPRIVILLSTGMVQRDARFES